MGPNAQCQAYQEICQAGIGTYSKYARLAFWVDFSDVTLVGEDEKEKSPPQLQILTLSQN